MLCQSNPTSNARTWIRGTCQKWPLNRSMRNNKFHMFYPLDTSTPGSGTCGGQRWKLDCRLLLFYPVDMMMMGNGHQLEQNFRQRWLWSVVTWHERQNFSVTQLGLINRAITHQSLYLSTTWLCTDTLLLLLWPSWWAEKVILIYCFVISKEQPTWMVRTWLAETIEGRMFDGSDG